MEANQKYALYDGDQSAPKQWVAHVRLTPELLRRLRENPDAVTLQLQAPSGGERTTRAVNSSTKLNSVLTISDASSTAGVRYEMLSFTEDPTTNVLGAMRAEDDGYAFHEVGRVHQKLIVQRMLDSVEKGRMKDKHAKSVIESKSRSSKLLTAEADQERKTGGAKSLVVTAAAAHDTSTLLPTRKRRLSSSLSAQQAESLHELITRVDDQQVEKEDTPLTARDADMLFPTDSEVDQEISPSQEQTRPTLPSGHSPKRAKAATKVTKVATKKRKTPATRVVEQEPTNPSSSQPTQVETVRATPIPAEGGLSAETLAGISQIASRMQRPNAASSEGKKRARPRANRLPDISFLPTDVQEICKRTVGHITRTSILDESDYESFLAEHDRLRGEWERLDKIYSVESILIDGAHFQLPFAVSEDEKRRLEDTIQTSEQRNEGLLLLRETMSTIYKILTSLQASILAYEAKLPPSNRA